MPRQKQSPQDSLHPDLPLDETERLLERVDEELLNRRFLQQTGSQPENEAVVPTIPLPPAGMDMAFPLAEMRGSEAPYFVINGSGLARMVKRLHNMVLKVFGRKQAYFNSLTINNLEILARDMEALREYNKIQSLQINLLAHRVRAQEKTIKELRARTAIPARRKTSGKKTG